MVKASSTKERNREYKRHVEEEAIALAAFQHLYKGPLEEEGLEALTENQAQTFVHKLHGGNLSTGNAPRNLMKAIDNALTSPNNNIPSRVERLNRALNFYSTWIGAANEHEQFGFIARAEPGFEEYATALEAAGAWEKDQRPDEATARKENLAYQTLLAWSTEFPKRYMDFANTAGLIHIRHLSDLIEAFYDNDPKRAVPIRRFGTDFLRYFTEGDNTSDDPLINGFAKTIALATIMDDPKKVGEAFGYISEYVDDYIQLEAEADLKVLDALPREGMTGPEQVREVAPKLARQKDGKEKKQERERSTKTFLGLARSLDLEKRVDLLEVVDRAITEHEVNPLDLYTRLKRTGISATEYSEFLVVGDQFKWKPESSQSTGALLGNQELSQANPIASYLMVARSNFNILKALQEIASHKSGVPAAKELIRNPSLLFVDENAVELVTIARDYPLGNLIVERYATVKNRGQNARADAILHVGQLRPSIEDLTYIRGRMRTLPEDDIRYISGCDTVEGIKHILRKQSVKKTQMPTRTESTSWFDLMKKSMAVRGASEEEIVAATKAHKILLGNGGNPRFLRNMFRTQPEDIGELCDDIVIHTGNEVFTPIIQRNPLFQRYKYGLATVPNFRESLANFVAQEHPNPYHALQEYLPNLPLVEDATPKNQILEAPPKEMPITEFPGRIFICGGTFGPELRRRITKELPGVIFGPNTKRLKKEGLPGLAKGDGVLWVVPATSHSAHDNVKKQCTKVNALFELSRSDGVSSVVRTIREKILTREIRT